MYLFAETWGPWQPWSLCSVSCGEGVRERVRECLLPSGVGGMQCTGMVKEQSSCSLENCVGQSSALRSTPPPLFKLFFFVSYFLLFFCRMLLLMLCNCFPFILSVACTISIPTPRTCWICTAWHQYGCGGWYFPLPGCNSVHRCGDCVEKDLPDSSVQLCPQRVHAFPWSTQTL